MGEAITLMTMYGVPVAIGTALIAWGLGLWGLHKRHRESRMSSDYVQHRIEKLERLLDDEWCEEDLGRNEPPPKDQRPVGFLPPPPPARRGISPVAQAARVTTANVQLVEAAMRLAAASGSSPEVAMSLLERASQSNIPAANMAAVGRLLTGSGTNQPAGVFTAGKPKAAKPPKIDKPRKRKVTLE